ncbi:MAG: methyltransferase domain-containing protein [Anaerolineae bacterium]|jgi:SAM-dependent methyltransferase|nr:methyltransferase domain-containing protein [Anaerolineae bacterium]
MITLHDLDFLDSAAGQALLAELRAQDLNEAHTLAILTRLRKRYRADQAAAALELARLQLKATEKFGPDADRLWFTRDALQQASDPLIRRYRAQQLSGRVIDACCGIGADAVAFAQAGASVIGIDLDPVRIAMAQHNAHTLGLTIAFTVGDVRDPLPQADAIFFDPARRQADDQRIYDVERYHPPLSVIRSWQADRIMVKLGPGVAIDQLAAYGGQVRFISVDGDLKEAVLSPDDSAQRYQAVMIARDGTIQTWERHPLPESRPLSPPLGWLIEPDPALIRAGLVQDLAGAIDAYQLDETIAYLTADQAFVGPYGRSWAIRSWLPFHLKNLRAALREANIGRVTVKKRGSPLTPETLISQLKLKGGGEACTLVLTRWQGEPIVIVCDEYPV